MADSGDIAGTLAAHKMRLLGSSVQVSRINFMSADVSYASIAIVDTASLDFIAVETISVTAETCELSGAWVLKNANAHQLEELISGRLVLVIGNMDVFKKYAGSNFTLITIQPFLDQAIRDAKNAMKDFATFVKNHELEYATYMAIKPADRKLIPKVTKKNLIEPSFSKWPVTVDLESPENELRELGKLSEISGTPIEMRKILGVSRLIQVLVNMWHSDEIERLNRLYIHGEDAQISVLPDCWLSLYQQAIS